MSAAHKHTYNQSSTHIHMQTFTRSAPIHSHIDQFVYWNSASKIQVAPPILFSSSLARCVVVVAVDNAMLLLLLCRCYLFFFLSRAYSLGFGWICVVFAFVLFQFQAPLLTLDAPSIQPNTRFQLHWYTLYTVKRPAKFFSSIRNRHIHTYIYRHTTETKWKKRKINRYIIYLL